MDQGWCHWEEVAIVLTLIEFDSRKKQGGKDIDGRNDARHSILTAVALMSKHCIQRGKERPSTGNNEKVQA